MNLAFEPLAHSYLIDGRRVASVTEVLRHVGYYDPSRYGHDPKYRQRGSAVHAACRLMDSGRYDEQQTHEEIRPYAKQYAEFLALTGFVARAWEVAMIDTEKQVGGTLDIIGECRGEIWLIDIKSGGLPNLVGVQLAAYEDLLMSATMLDNAEMADFQNVEFLEYTRRNKSRIRRKSLQLRPEFGAGKLRA